MKTTIYIERHGESVGNITKHVLGHTDLDLTENGFKQIEATGEKLKDVNFSAIYSSDLIRALHTAEPHAKRRNMTIITSKELRELYFGDWENACVDDLLETCHDMYVVDWRGNFGTFTPPKGEYVQDMANRMLKKVLEIAEKHQGETVLITTHAAAIRALWGKILNYAPEDVCANVPFPTNASYSILEYENGKLTPISFSQDDHLTDCPPLPIMKI